MIFYKPIINIDDLKNKFKNVQFSDGTYGGYIGLDEDNNVVGDCLVMINGYNCHILSLNCDFTDELLVEGFLRASLNFCANRNAYMAHCSIEDVSSVLLHLGFENNCGIYSGDIPTLLKGSCCK